MNIPKKYRRKKRKRKEIDISGKKFGRWTAVKEVEKSGSIRHWLCKCECGTERAVNYYSLKNGNSISCGCYHKEKLSSIKLIDLTGKRFGHLVVLKRVSNNPNSAITRWLCQCDCGNTTTVYKSHLINGDTQSCGCQKGSGGIPFIIWSDGEEEKLVELLNLGMPILEISKEIGRNQSAINARITLLKREKNIRRCADPECSIYFKANHASAKYCSNKCRWRDSKRKVYKERKKLGLCKQCGGEMDKDDITYCSKCQEYFKTRYYDNKKSDLQK